MKQLNVDQDTVIEDVPVSPLFGSGRKNRYGSVPGLDDEELADPDELERQVYRQGLEPVLLLPYRKSCGGGAGIQASIDEDGRVEWGAFGTVDFERMQPEFDKAKYKAEKLREELKDLVIRISCLDEKVQSRGKYRVLKYVRMGWLDVDDIADWNLWFMARYWMRAVRLRREIAELEEASFKRRQGQAEAVWARLGD